MAELQYVRPRDRTYPNIEYWFEPVNCYGGVATTYWLTATDRVLIAGWNNPEHRAKPAILTENLTPQSLQYTGSYNMASCYTETWKWRKQSAGCKAFTRMHYYRTFNANHLGPLSDPDWATEMRLKIKDYKINLGVSLIEYRQTVRMFNEFAHLVRDGWRLYRGKFPVKKRKRLTPCSVAAAELVYSYGISPLASDLYDSAMELYYKLGLPITRRFYIKKRVTDSSTITPGGQLFFDLDIERETSVAANFYVDFMPDQSTFTLGNPAELLWEIIPFSFVVDWALPIGDWLSSIDALRGTQNIRGTLVRKVKYSHSSRVRSPYLANLTAKASYHSHEREVAYGIPLPSFPRYSPSASYRTLLNAVSLLVGVNQRCKHGVIR